MVDYEAWLAVRPDLHRKACNLRRLRLLEIVQHGRLHCLAGVRTKRNEGREVGEAGVGRGRIVAAKAAAHPECVRRDEPYLLELLADILNGVVLRQVAHGIGERDLCVVYGATVEARGAGMVVAASASKNLLLSGGNLFVEYLRLGSGAAHGDGIGKLREVVCGDRDGEARRGGGGDPRTGERGGVFVARGHQEKLESIERKGLRCADVAFNDGDAVIEGERTPLADLEVL